MVKHIEGLNPELCRDFLSQRCVLKERRVYSRKSGPCQCPSTNIPIGTHRRQNQCVRIETLRLFPQECRSGEGRIQGSPTRISCVAIACTIGSDLLCARETTQLCHDGIPLPATDQRVRRAGPQSDGRGGSAAPGQGRCWPMSGSGSDRGRDGGCRRRPNALDSTRAADIESRRPRAIDRSR